MENYSYNSSYPESGDSSPRSREIDFENPPPWEDSNQPPPNYKVKFMCSYGGKIHPRPHDNQLSYVGGETKILAVDRNIKFNILLSKLIALCDSDSISFKYQLPGEDLDALISVTNDDDLEHMMHEYDRLYRISPKPARLRIFIFPSGQSANPSLSSSGRSFGSDEVKSEKERFVEALNAPPIITPPPQASSPAAPPPPPATGNMDFLFGLEKANANAMAAAGPVPVPVPVPQPVLDDPVGIPVMDDRFGSDPIQKHIQDLQRLRLEEQQRRKSDDGLSGGYAGVSAVSGGGEYFKPVPEKIPPVTVSGGVPYWPENKPVHGGVFPASGEQPVYMIPAQANAYHPQMVRPAPTQGYYTVQRIPSEVYREQQQQMYNVMPAAPPQKMAGYPEGYGMVRPATTGGVATEGGYAQVAYDGRQVIYAAPGGVMGAPPGATAAQYQAMAAAAASGEMRHGGALNTDAGGKVVAKATQPSV